MGILRHREELLPVTCAVLSAEDRNTFFSQLKKKCGGRVEKIAAAGGTNKATVADWMSGKANVPYRALQKLSSDFNITLPAISELRREFQAVVEMRVAKPPRPVIPPPEETREKPRREAGTDRGRRERAEPKPKPKRARLEPKAKRERPQPKPKREHAEAKAAKESGPRIPKLSDKAAYWTGTTLAGARREGDAVIFKIDSKLGQNFTRVWAKLSEELFGVRPELQGLEQASLPIKGIEDFVNRLELKEGLPSPGAPRWAWSNPDWKIAFLRGVVDASACFKRDPALEIEGLSERLVQSIKKLFAGIKMEVKPDENEGEVGEPSIVLEGREQLKRYYDEVGTGNFKLSDQLKAFFKETGGAEAPSGEKTAGPAKKKSRRGGKGRGRGRGRGRKDPRLETPGETAAAEFAGGESGPVDAGNETPAQD